MIVSERGNLTGGIFLSISRMSTVKIRARSLFRTPLSRIGATGADSGVNRRGFPRLCTAPAGPSQVVHRHLEFRTCRNLPPRCKVE
jgi:hypothetical protein